jgi:hypothetical protein
LDWDQKLPYPNSGHFKFRRLIQNLHQFQ